MTESYEDLCECDSGYMATFCCIDDLKMTKARLDKFQRQLSQMLRMPTCRVLVKLQQKILQGVAHDHHCREQYRSGGIVQESRLPIGYFRESSLFQFLKGLRSLRSRNMLQGKARDIDVGQSHYCQAIEASRECFSSRFMPCVGKGDLPPGRHVEGQAR